jgi:hypothetical protein
MPCNLLALPQAFDHFNGFYAAYPHFILFNSIRLLVVEGLAALLVLIGAVWGIVRLVKRRRGKLVPRTATASS